MEEHKILITTSGLGSRLGSLTDYTNKSLIRIGNKPAISYIIESYPKDSKFVITLGHFGSHVKQFLSLAYPEHDFQFIEIDKYKGPGSSLGYSIYKCKEVLNCPFIFHASDTIIDGLIPNNPNKNYIVGSHKEDSSQYRTLNLSDGKLLKINEKGELGYDFSYVGICGIKDYKLFFDKLKNLIDTNFEDISDVHVINEMLSNVEFEYQHLEHQQWFDIGNTAELNKTRKYYKGDIDVLDKRDESIFFFDDFVIKFFYDSKINNKRVLRAENLRGLVPNVTGHTENFYKYIKAEGELFSKSVNTKKFKSLLSWSKQNLWTLYQDNNFKDKCYDFYITKTNKRIEQFLEFKDDRIEFINGEMVPPVMDLINSIKIDWICNGIPSKFHGDFILDNIIETKDSFVLIDWRQDFAEDLNVGDLYYDLAKLNHNLVINHDIVSKNLFSFEKNNCYILTNSKLNECREFLYEFINANGYDLKKVKVLTSIIWLNMAPLHEYPLNKFLFYFGKYNLFKALNYKYKENKTISTAVSLVNPEYNHVLEFGVKGGITFRQLRESLNLNFNLFGFDSFQGLPEDWEGTTCKKGDMSTGGKIPEIPNTVIYPGWFKDTLQEYKKVAEPIALLHIDCDLYSSTKEVLYELKNYIVSGTIIVFDEWYYNWFDLEENRQGEQKAFIEWANEFNIKYEVFPEIEIERRIVKIL